MKSQILAIHLKMQARTSVVSSRRVLSLCTGRATLRGGFRLHAPAFLSTLLMLRVKLYLHRTKIELLLAESYLLMSLQVQGFCCSRTADELNLQICDCRFFEKNIDIFPQCILYGKICFIFNKLCKRFCFSATFVTVP